ncbi:MAG: hypothetical protein GDA56_30320 [Hormoscilla sp. GM7CHS1pb]|nr:hypothetical protein [Hormoscilla sp. GM7CHS1pb]
MNNKPRIPDAQTRAKNVARMREAIRQIDAFTYQLDELLAMVEEHNRRSPLTAYRLGKLKGPATQNNTQE